MVHAAAKPHVAGRAASKLQPTLLQYTALTVTGTRAPSNRAFQGRQGRSLPAQTACHGAELTMELSAHICSALSIEMAKNATTHARC
jgi:hypothetical protein